MSDTESDPEPGQEESEDCLADLLGDTNRDTHITAADEPGKRTWRWEPGGHGAIALYNCDDDGPPPGIDADNSVVDTPDDLPDFADLLIKRWPGMPRGWSATLSVSARDQKLIRIFDRRAGKAKEIIGPTKGATYTIPDLRRRDLRYIVETVTFPDRDKQGGAGGKPEVDVALEVHDGEDCIRCSDRVRFRIAPWMMIWNGRPNLEVYVVEIDDHAATLAHFNNLGFLKELSALVAAAGAQLVVIDGSKYHYDRWIQDQMEVGFTRSPFQRFHVVLNSLRPRGLSPYPLTLLGPDYGYHEETASLTQAVNSRDSFGNLEVSPPVKTPAKDYKLGRIVLGGDPAPGSDKEMNPSIVHFVEDQIVQHPTVIDTSWLAVGHVDETISFVPANGGRGFKMLIASPRRALAILRLLRRLGLGKSAVLKGRNDYFGLPAETTVRDVLADTALAAFNRGVQRHLAGIRNQLTGDLALRPNEIVDIPVLFTPVPEGAEALTANMVNLLVVNRMLIVPKPFGAEVLGIDTFEEYFRLALAGSGDRIEFIDDWDCYHVMEGEVHCGTNARREPERVPWWKMEEGGV